MSNGRVLFFYVLSTAFLSMSSSADTDIVYFLNSNLKNKSNVSYHRDVEVKRRVCDWSGEVKRICYIDTELVRRNYADSAVVKNVRVIEVRGLTFDDSKVVAFPETAKIARLDYYNCGPGTFSTSESITLSGTKGWSISKTKGISSGMTVSFSQSFNIPGSNTTFGVSQNVSLNSSTTAAESSSTTDSRTTTASVSAKTGEAGYYSMLVYQTNADIPFHAVVIVDGDLVENDSGYKQALDILSETERTMEFSGILHLTGLSNAKVENKMPDVPFECSSLNSKSYSSGVVYDEVPVASLNKTFVANFGSEMEVYKKSIPISVKRVFEGKDKTTEGKAKGLSDGPTIGNPDGTSYIILSTTSFIRPTVACGFNDLSVANAGNYSLEERHYETWTDGKMVASWNSSVETFLGCASGP